MKQINIDIENQANLISCFTVEERVDILPATIYHLATLMKDSYILSMTECANMVFPLEEGVEKSLLVRRNLHKYIENEKPANIQSNKSSLKIEILLDNIHLFYLRKLYEKEGKFLPYNDDGLIIRNGREKHISHHIITGGYIGFYKDSILEEMVFLIVNKQGNILYNLSEVLIAGQNSLERRDRTNEIFKAKAEKEKIEQNE